MAVPPLVQIVAGLGGEQTGTGRRWSLPPADGGYQGNREVIMPYRRPRDGSEPPVWQHELNTVHKRVRARIENAFAHMKRWNILRHRRRKRNGVHHATRGIALQHNLAIAG